MKVMADLLVVLMHLMVVLTALTSSYLLAAVTGLVAGMNLGVGHNFQHQKNNFRRYYMELATFPTTDWRLIHILSHHMFTNTYNDSETQGVYPMVDFNAHRDKGVCYRRLSQAMVHVRGVQ